MKQSQIVDCFKTSKKYKFDLQTIKNTLIFAVLYGKGELAERSNAAVLKTVDCNRSWGSNP